MTAALTVLIVGGYGTFGGRIVELLEDEPRLTLIIAGRFIDKARAYCRSRPNAKTRLLPAIFDRNGDVEAQLLAHKPDILVDASGPFQAYGAGQYRIIEACIARGVHYLDLADGSDFVAGVKAFDERARRAGLYVLSGVSSFPVLTAAVVRHLTSDGARVSAIRAGIAPSPYAGVGENVIRAIAGYAGQRIPLKRDGRAVRGAPFTEQMRFTIAPPGRLPLPSTMFSLVDVPDLRALAELWPEARTIWMGAGPTPEILHRALIAFAWLVRMRLAPTLSPLAPLMHFATNHIRWGEHRGGMFVAIECSDQAGTQCRRSWHLLAEGDDGPLIPSMAVEALVRKALDGHSPPPGSRAGVRDLELADYERLFANRTIYTGDRSEVAGDDRTPLYERILGTAWSDLPDAIRALHSLDDRLSATGQATVERGAGMLARLAASLIGFPEAATDIPVKVEFRTASGVETWTRTFGAEAFSSRQFAGEGRLGRLLCEQFGPLVFAMALVVNDGCLQLAPRRWSIFGVPLPSWLGPRAHAYEAVEDGRFRFHVEITHPLCGLIVRYRGWLVPDAAERAADVPSKAAS